MNDQLIGKKELREATTRLQEHGKQATLDLFDREPVLAQHLADRTEELWQLLLRCGTRPQEVQRIITAVIRLLMEAAVSLDRAHRGLMQGLLPDAELRTRPMPPPGGHDETK